MPSNYSEEYLAKLIKAALELLFLVLPLLGFTVTDDVRVQAAGAATAGVVLVSFALTLFTIFRQKQKEGLSTFGRILPTGPRAKAGY